MTTGTRTASEQITEEVTSWPGVEAGPARAASTPSRSAGARSAICTATTRRTSRSPARLERAPRAGRIVDHPVFPGKVGPAARRIRDEDDVRDVIVLMRLNYDRIVERHGLPG